MESYRFQEMLTIRQVAEILKVKDNDTALRWLALKGVPIHSELKVKRVYAFSFAFALDLDLAQTLRTQHPHNWKHLYFLVSCNSTIYDCVMTEIISAPITTHVTQKMGVKNIDEKKLMKKILGK